ncbi:peroxiredoxin-like 2C isoform X1 [Erpetoichthys calabaricus]|uniref:Peroxiredoxin like 2C n=1 Tax=Erpetoichthys calabaricus TaxID=27687 RepID=A0A8C4RYI8_ERPCA|nr:peroxiredoxin-like 2C isoform X1 [Erpetoichthys calabaricus]
MAVNPPVTQQITRTSQERPNKSAEVDISALRDCIVFDRHGEKILFRSLYENKKAILIFVRHFLCYTCKEYVEDLAKIPKCFLSDADVRLIVIGQSSYQHIEAFRSITGYQHYIYVDPDKEIYKTLGMKKDETFTREGSQSPHVKSNGFSGSIKSIWRAMSSPAFDFQGDPKQQGGALILGPGDNIHFAHYDMNSLDHMPINELLQLAGVQTVDFKNNQIITV